MDNGEKRFEFSPRRSPEPRSPCLPFPPPNNGLFICNIGYTPNPRLTTSTRSLTPKSWFCKSVLSGVTINAPELKQTPNRCTKSPPEAALKPPELNEPEKVTT